jgi:hypothetical protein
VGLRRRFFFEAKGALLRAFCPADIVPGEQRRENALARESSARFALLGLFLPL